MRLLRTCASKVWWSPPVRITRRTLELALVSASVLHSTARIRGALRRDGVIKTFHALARPTARRPVPFHELARADAVLCWWLLLLRSRALCLERSLVMAERLCRAEEVGVVELVVGVRRGAAGGLEGHSWLMIDGQEFRSNVEGGTRLRPILRLRRDLREPTGP